MKTIQARTTAALLIVAGSMIPAFAQGGGERYGRGREVRGEDRRGGGQQYRQRDSQPQYPQRSDGGQEQRYTQQRYAQERYAQQQYRQQEYRPPDYRPRNNYRGGNWYGFRQEGGMRWAERGGYRGRFIPENRFYISFGRQHFFRFGRPVYYNGYPRFSYGGYGFRILDPVPAYWGDNWYDSDDVYVDYGDDGYYMYNRSYPGAGIAIGIDFQAR